MPKSNRSTRTDLDWYLISVDRLRQIAILVVVAVLAVAGWYYFAKVRNDPRVRAQSAIQSAESAIRDLAALPDVASYRSEFDRARAGLTEAQRRFAESEWAPAEQAALEARTIARSAIARQQGSRDSDAQFLSVEGDVQYQKAGAEWRPADARTPLYNGDWVKTGSNASAELIFSNGSLYTVGPGALLEIYSAVNPQTSRRSNTVQMQVGSVEINTTDDASTVRTPGTQVVVASDSTTQVGVAENDRSTRVLALKGSATVSPASGGAALELGAGEQLRADREGALESREAFLPPPALQAPADNLILRSGTTPRVEFAWSEVPGASGYQLQVARSRLFAAPEIDARRRENSAAAEVSREGLFYWRVATVADDGTPGPYSPFRRFRVAGAGGRAGQTSSDRIPPSLELDRPFNIGGAYYMIQGRAEPGTTVFVNDDEADTVADGSFRKLVSFTSVGWNTVVVKAVDPAGNETVRTERVHVKD